jgi:exosortase/archaeosortase family protein
VPTDTRRASALARSYALRLVAWSLALFGLFRLPSVEAHVLLPLTQLQAAAGAAIVGPSSMPVAATLACSGADALALCFAAIVAYPVRWSMRAAGVAGGAVVILALNTIRIGTLGRAAASPWWFDALHVYLWPAVLTIAIAGFVFTWMRASDAVRLRAVTGPSRFGVTSPPVIGDPTRYGAMNVRFAIVAAVLLLLFTLAAPLYLGSARVLAVAVMVARAAAFLLRGAGVDATAAAGVLATPGGAYLVTQECIATPLIPVYLAAVLVYARTWTTLALWTAAAAPLFVALGVARLLVVVVPAGVDAPPAFLVHAFSQLLMAAGMVCALALWRYGTRAATAVRIAAALALAIAFVQVAGTPYTRAIMSFRTGAAPVGDPQGALMFLPAFQAGLFLALWLAAFVPTGWTRFVVGASLLAVVQIAVAGGVDLVALHAGFVPLVRDVRAWALVGPALIIAAVVNVAPSRR